MQEVLEAEGTEALGAEKGGAEGGADRLSVRLLRTQGCEAGWRTGARVRRIGPGDSRETGGAIPALGEGVVSALVEMYVQGVLTSTVKAMNEWACARLLAKTRVWADSPSFSRLDS